MINIFFGEIGSGKSYHGRMIAEKAGIPFYEGDDFLPQKYKDKISKGWPLSKAEARKFVLIDLVRELDRLYSYHNSRGESFVVSQALYSRMHRNFLFDCFNRDVRYIWVKSPGFFRHLRQLANRPHSVMWTASMLLSKPFFELPVSSLENRPAHVLDPSADNYSENLDLTTRLVAREHHGV